MTSTTESMSSPKVVTGGSAGAAPIPASAPSKAWTSLAAPTSTLTHNAPKTAPEESRSSIVDDLTSLPVSVRVT